MTEQIQTRKAAAFLVAVLLAIGGINVWRGHILRGEVAFGTGLLCLVIAITMPGLAQRAYRVWMRFAFTLGSMNSRIVLFLLYYVVLFPIGLMMRLAGNDPLRRRSKPSVSYWVLRPHTRQRQHEFERLF